MNFHAAKAFILHKLERELPAELSYHSVKHTRDVLYATQELCYLEKVGPYERMLLKTAALFHDSGFTISHKNHEEHGCLIARRNLPRYGYTGREIEQICGMIMATQIPQSPKNHLEQILCDADLDYLGRDDFYDIGATLFQELQHFNQLQNELAWNKLQVKFLSQHRFWNRQ